MINDPAFAGASAGRQVSMNDQVLVFKLMIEH